ncbi:MAG: GGDEF domain-containing protein [Thermoleophilia bacterium]|nr:GGDEF domain-containing protein [Thermoleophilia bacterium]MDH3724824.1 GGDEF domain-containing protein [Thermoleophilia bacterium]
MSSPSPQTALRPPIGNTSRHGPANAAIALAGLLLIVAIGGAVLVGGIRDSSAALAEAQDRRATVESLERESTRIEIAGWRVWRARDEFALAPRATLLALALFEQTRTFYSERARRAPPKEAALAGKALALLDAVPGLVGATRGEESAGADLTTALRRFPEFRQQQEAIHTAWLENNQGQIATYERRRDGWVWAGLAALAALILALGCLPAVLVRRNARLQRETIDQLRRQAATDALTGLVNQAEFYERLVAAVRRAHEGGEKLSVIVLDVDHFKRINDAHGHQVGDRVLAEIARRILEAARSQDCVGRVGGEEFAWILPRVAEQDAVDAARRARRAVASEPVLGVGSLTVSAGVAGLEPGIDAVVLYRRADLALYRAKEGGRDAVVRHSFGEDAARGPRILSPP